MGAGIRCITIIHPADEIIEYRTISAFLRLFGIFVCERLEGMSDGDETDARIVLGKEESPKTISELLDVLEDSLGKDTIDVLKKAEEIYTVNDLMRGCYAIEFFATARDPVIHEDMLDSYDRFSEALNRFKELADNISEEDQLSMKYILAAQANCMRRMNQLYNTLWDAAERGWYKGEDGSDALKKKLLDRTYYFNEAINPLIERILKIDSDYYGAYSIKALNDMLDEDAKADSIVSFRTAVSMIGDKSYSSYLRYRMGRFYEYILRDPKKSLDNYKKSYEADPYNYRAIYKLAARAQRQEDYEQAMEYLDMILSVLGRKKKSCALQPIECAYLFKAYKNKGKIYLKQKKYQDCIAEMKQAVEVYNNHENEDPGKGFYSFMFGEKKEKYKEAAKQNLQVWKVYEIMTDAAVGANQYDDYKEYLFLAEEYRNKVQR